MDSGRRLRIVLYILLTVACVFVVTSDRPILPFSPPTEAARLAAAGLSPLPEAERRAFTPGDDFAPIPAPGPGDWILPNDDAIAFRSGYFPGFNRTTMSSASVAGAWDLSNRIDRPSGPSE